MEQLKVMLNVLSHASVRQILGNHYRSFSKHILLVGLERPCHEFSACMGWYFVFLENLELCGNVMDFGADKRRAVHQMEIVQGRPTDNFRRVRLTWPQ